MQFNKLPLFFFKYNSIIILGALFHRRKLRNDMKENRLQCGAKLIELMLGHGSSQPGLYRGIVIGFLMASLFLTASCNIFTGAAEIFTTTPTTIPTVVVTKTPTPSPVPEPTATPTPPPATPTPTPSPAPSPTPIPVYIAGLPVIEGLDTSWIPPEGLSAGKERTGMIAYLTFDDGPSPSKTLKVLSILNTYGIKATFFIVGQKITIETTPVLNKIAENGHAIGNHTTTHFDSYKSFEHFQMDVDTTSRKIKDITGITTHLFRYPGGSSVYMADKIFPDTSRFLSERGLVYFDWNTSCGDGNGSVIYTAQQLCDNVMLHANKQKTFIILMHDSGSPDVGHDQVGALPLIIHSLYDRGYRFSELTPGTPSVQFRKS